MMEETGFEVKPVILKIELTPVRLASGKKYMPGPGQDVAIPPPPITCLVGMAAGFHGSMMEIP